MKATILTRICLRCWRSWFDSWVGKIRWRRGRLLTPVFLGFCGDLAGRESPCSVEDLGLIPGLGTPPGEGKGYSLQYPGLEYSINYLVHGVTNSWTWLSDFHFHVHILSPSFPCGAAVKNPTANAGDMRCGLDPWVRKIPWRRAWQPTPLLLPGESYGQRSLRATAHRVAESSIGLKQLEHMHAFCLYHF